MNNHWHMVLGPHDDVGMGKFLRWITLTHTKRYHAHHAKSVLDTFYWPDFKVKNSMCKPVSSSDM